MAVVPLVREGDGGRAIRGSYREVDSGFAGRAGAGEGAERICKDPGDRELDDEDENEDDSPEEEEVIYDENE